MGGLWRHSCIVSHLRQMQIVPLWGKRFEGVWDGHHNLWPNRYVDALRRGWFVKCHSMHTHFGPSHSPARPVCGLKWV
jgi:hypothetical protein